MASEPPQRPWSAYLVGFLGHLLIATLGATWRVRVMGRDPLAAGEQALGALWHEGIFVGVYRFRWRKAMLMVSQSKDGELIEAVIERFGFAPSARGSASRHGLSALKQLMGQLRKGGIVALNLDGPRGPRRKIKNGILTLARHSELPIQPVALAAAPCIRFNSWDRMFLPLPFAKVLCYYGTPIHVPKDADDVEQERCGEALQTELDRITKECEQILGITE